MKKKKKRKHNKSIVPANISAPSTESKSSRLPIDNLEDDELIDRYEWLLKACYLQGRRILIPTDIHDIFHECRIEVDRRNLGARINFPPILCPDDEMPVMHQESIVRYLREPHLTDFLTGAISFAPAADYRTQLDLARKDNEHLRPYAIFPNQSVTIGCSEYAASKIRMRREIRREDGSLFPYHFVSFSEEQSRKLARDFPADGAVLIRDYQRFYYLVRKQLAVEQPGATTHLQNVQYYDPFAVDPSTGGSMDILWRKPIQFIYQREVRIVILGGAPESARINIRISPPKGLLKLIKFG